MQIAEFDRLYIEVLRLRKSAFVSITTVLLCLPAWSLPVRAQEAGAFGGVKSIGVSSSYSPTSSHIFIGQAEERRIWTLGIDYSFLIHRTAHYRLDYLGSLMPLFEETDPTLIGTTFLVAGQPFITSQTPVRVTYVAKAPIGYTSGTVGPASPIYAIFGRQDTYGAAFSPLGARITGMPRWRIQPMFAIDLGFTVSARDVPVDRADQFNYMFALGPGFQVFSDAHTSWRAEYIYRHTSNAHQGTENPGVDQGVVRVTLSHHW
jgi:Lipid A 3-O-deacylase (PagL)